MIQTLVTLGGIAFWVIVAVVFLACVAAVENEKASLATLIVVVFLAGLLLVTDFDARWLLRNWPLLMAGVAAYIVLAVAHAFLKWKAKLITKREEFRTKEPRMRQRYEEVNKKTYPTFKEYMASEGYPPQASEHRSTIISWMAYWPFHMTWTVLQWPWRLFSHIADWLVGTFRRMADNAFADVR